VGPQISTQEGQVAVSEHGDTRRTTGDQRVDAVVAKLDDLDNVDLPAQLEVLADLQASLAQLLDDEPILDMEPGLDEEPLRQGDGGTASEPAS